MIYTASGELKNNKNNIEKFTETKTKNKKIEKFYNKDQVDKRMDYMNHKIELLSNELIEVSKENTELKSKVDLFGQKINKLEIEKADYFYINGD
tara:strand:+ start:2213 stop:2494 length:282 start_codon:yes stop_codon:yes gene_type:complete